MELCFILVASGQKQRLDHFFIDKRDIGQACVTLHSDGSVVNKFSNCMPASKAQLSCLQCVRRKKKCDKETPCSACIDKGLECNPVERKRLPRGRSGRTKTSKHELTDRLAALERVIAGWQQDKSAHTQPPEKIHVSGVALDFWDNLADTFSDIRGVLQTEVSDDSTVSESYASPDNEELFLFGKKRSAEVQLDRSIVSQAVERLLLELYGQRFDPLLKVFDWRAMKDSWQSTDGSAISLPQAAVLFAASITLLPQDGMPQGDVISHLRSLCEYKLSVCGLLTTRSVQTLRAFVVYLAALRATHAHAEQWMLLPLAIRMATSLGISGRHLHQHSGRSSQEARLWYCIGMLDMQSAFDRGSEPLMSRRDFPPTSMLPDLIHENISHPPSYRSFTSMSTSELTYRATLCQRSLLESTAIAIHSQLVRESWCDSQQAIIAEFEDYIQASGLAFGNENASTSALQLLTMAIARESALTMRLLVHRPLQRLPDHLRPASGVDSFDVLGSAITILESADFKLRHEFAQWSWYTWVKWYVLAIALAELCRLPSPWPQQAAHAWSLITMAYDKYAKLVSDTEGGLLWKPIARLYSRVHTLWQQQVHLHSAPDSSDMTTEDDLWTGILPMDLDFAQWNLFLDDLVDPSLLDTTSAEWEPL